MSAIKRIKSVLFLCILLAQSIAYGDGVGPSELTQTLQIYTNFKSIVGKPSWLLIIRDADSGLVSPYLFDIHNNDNFWLAFSSGHNYQITASTLTFEGCGEIKNFCHLENGIISGKSMYMTLSGTLTPDPRSLRCNVMKYGDTKFTIVKKEETPKIKTLKVRSVVHAT